MPQLTRRRYPERPDCWHVYYGDVHVGTIAVRTGIPPGEDPWGLSNRTEAVSRHGAINGTGPPRNIGDLIGVSECPMIGALRGDVMKIALISIAAAMLATVATAGDDDLPTEMFLRCDVRDITSIVSNGKEDLHSDTEVKYYRLKDGIFQATNGSVPLGTECKLYKGEVVCKYNKTLTSKSAQSRPKVEKRESFVTLIRGTGEIRLNLRIESYDGESIKGSPSFTLTSITEGTCRAVGKPLF
jgi:hypothetical protein